MHGMALILTHQLLFSVIRNNAKISVGRTVDLSSCIATADFRWWRHVLVIRCRINQKDKLRGLNDCVTFRVCCIRILHLALSSIALSIGKTRLHRFSKLIFLLLRELICVGFQSRPNASFSWSNNQAYRIRRLNGGFVTSCYLIVSLCIVVKVTYVPLQYI